MRAFRGLVALTFVAGCAAAHTELDAATSDAATIDAGPDTSVIDASAPPDANLVDANLPDGDLVVHSRCASPPSTRALAVTYGGACRVDDTGQLWCWGQNEWGQVRPGGGTWVEPHEVAYEGLSDVVSVANSGQHACVVHRDGGVSCWGSDRYGELGDASTTSTTRPMRVPGIADVDRIVLEPGASCARTRDTRWWCWGEIGYMGQAFGVTGTPGPGPFEVPGLRGASELSLGYTNAAALFPDGHVEAVSVPESRIAHRYTLVGIVDAIDVVAFDSYACALGRNGHVWCAGEPTVADDPPPAEVPGIDDARAFARGGRDFLEACVIRADGSLWCWTLARPPAPWPVPGAGDIDIAAIGSQICVSTCGGQVVCNGVGWRGENGDDVTRVPPAEIPGITDAVAIDGSCALHADGTVSCWDEGRSVSYDAPCGPIPAPVEPQLGIDHVVRLEDGAAIRDDGSIVCLGNPMGALPALPAAAVDATCTSDLAYAITADGRLYDWTTPPGGTIGSSLLTTPAPVAELTSAAIRTTDGRVFDLTCMDFFGVVCGLGSAWPGITDADAVWTGGGGDAMSVAETDCVRHVGGRVDCRFEGNALSVLPPLLGIATPAAAELVHVPLLDGATQIAPDGTSLCARDAAGAVRCWGDGQFGRLGDDDVTVRHTTPVASGAIDLAADRSVCALGADGHVTCWGLVAGGWGSGAVCPLPLDRTVHIP